MFKRSGNATRCRVTMYTELMKIGGAQIKAVGVSVEATGPRPELQRLKCKRAGESSRRFSSKNSAKTGKRA